VHTLESTYPRAVRQPVVDQLHGRAVPDPYRWLEDASDPKTRTWQADQDELWRRTAGTLPGRFRFLARTAELSGVGVVGEPMWRGDRQFFVRRTAQQEHAALYVEGPDGDPRPLVDPTALDPSGGTTLDHWQPSLDGQRIAVQLSRGGTEQSELSVLDVATGQVVDGPVDRCRYSPVAWLADGAAFYYVRAGQVRLRRLDRRADTVVLPDPASYGLEISADGRWLTISAARGLGNDLWLADVTASTLESPTLTAVQRGGDARSVATVGRDGRLYVVTTFGAAGIRVCIGDPTRPGPEHWHELIPADSEAPLTDIAIVDGSELDRPLLLVTRTRHALGEIHVHDLRSGQRLGAVPLPGLGSIGTLTTRPTGGHEVWFTYTDSVTPATVYRYDARTGETTLWARPPGTVDLPETAAKQLTYTSADGTPIRMTVLARRGVTGPRPTILYGYGGFGQSLTPTFSSLTLGWVEAGGIFVTAHLRGGGEEGEQWHAAGCREHKQNAIDDFVAAAEALIADGWTTPEQLGILGESNGGLLVGAALTQRPELFAAAVCSSPVLDMVRYERFGLGASWIAEYGSVAEPEQLDWLLGYSPYHRVRTGEDYPAVLLTTAGGDTRVDPMHARKMCAALQHATRGERPVLYRQERDMGHGPASVSRGVALAADTLAFLAAHTGLTA
jgi:prolyl oligopeptidase